MNTSQQLRDHLRRIDHRGYPAYKDLAGAYQFQGYVFSIDHVQGDPFASPSRVSIHVSGKVHGFGKELYDTKEKRIALQDMILRRFSREVQEFTFQAKGSGKSGLMSVSRPGQEMLDRSACQFDRKSDDLVLRMEIGFPANGRSINAGELDKILFDFLPVCVKKSLHIGAYKPETIQKVLDLAEDQRAIRDQLEKIGLAAFVANGSILPRANGVSDKPMQGGIPFRSPESLEVTMTMPHLGQIRGMGIKKGVTLIVGGGYHGKSTLLEALELGIYNHIAGDGREYVITDDTAVKVRAEDGRSIRKADISLFINNLPNGKDTVCFDTEDASGSTSQAGNIVEAVEAGSRTLLLDEDTSAANFMMRDELMKRVVHAELEPITPFIDCVRGMYEEGGISTILVAGSCGAYFHQADTIIQMKQYVPVDITEAARAEAENFPESKGTAVPYRQPSFDRKIKPVMSWKKSERGVKLKVMGTDGILLDKETIDLRYVEQLTDSEQLHMLGYMMRLAGTALFDGKRTLQQVLDEFYSRVEQDGFEAVCRGNAMVSGLAMVRKQELYACVNRYRGLRL